MAGKARSISWIHLSDLHVDRRGDCDDRFDRDQERCWSALEDDIAEVRKAQEGGVSRPLDMIILSGDVVKRGEDHQLFEHAHECLARCCEAAGIPPERVFVIPGNHDIDRRRIRTEHEASLDLSKLRTTEFRQRIDLLWDSPKTIAEIDEKFTAFREFASRYAPVEWGVLSSWTSKIEIEDSTVDLIGLNSVWTGGTSDLDRPGMPVVGRPQRESVDELGDGLARTTLVLQHNPTSYLHAIDSSQHASWLDDRDAVVFCGHLHQSELAERRSLRGRHVELMGGALYAGYEYHRRYSVGTLELGDSGRRFTIALRAADSESDFFAPDLLRYRAAENGIAEFTQDDDMPNLGSRLGRHDQLEIEAERAFLRFDRGVYRVRIEKTYRNPTDHPWLAVEARILVNAFPDDPEASRTLYREHPLELDEVGFIALRDGENVEWRVVDDHDSSKDLLILLGNPADDSTGLQPNESTTVTYEFEIADRFWGPYFERHIRRITQSILVELDFPRESLREMSLVRNPLIDSQSMDDEVEIEKTNDREIYRWGHSDPEFQSRYRFSWRFQPGASG
jgi:predicted MPP superfamily phosphohydrolase